MRVRRPALKTFGAIAAAVLAAAPFASAVHLLAEPHEVCADHGELVHGDHGRAAPDSDATDSVRGEATADSHEHDHCLLGATAAGPSLRPSRVGAGSSTVALPAGLSARGADPVALDSLYRIAPKNSPPV